ncbi:hypothetical protein NRIC_38210 [Enterococcus florum]|uniref:Uncharacterized protein n=1 Tax=Enterococcus florum TaxID=2480627 RepID=A0A4P5PCQ9_9ENTE|nr:hypothetical protein [Enterococcus florum]GCF95930.1 hypothetical protein NRIC_38210 [Enterococcus florum]
MVAPHLGNMFVLLFPLGYLLLIAIGYFVIRKAVKDGILDAEKEKRKLNNSDS